MARIIAAELSALDGAVLCAVGSRSEDRAHAFAKDFQIPHAHGSYEALVVNPDVDVIYVSTPHFRHVEDVKLCLDLGKNVLCERPFALKPDDVEPLVQLARERKLFLMEGMWTRFIPGICALRELIADKVIGDIKMIVGGGGFIPTDETAPHIYDPDHGGGALLDSGIDLISLATMIFGKPTTVNGIAALSEEGVDEQDGILLGYSHGRIANLYVTIKAVQPPYLTLLGTQGSIEVIPPVYAPQFHLIVDQNGSRRIHHAPFEGTGYAFELEEVMRCLRAGELESPLMPLEETLRILDITNEVRLQIGLRFPYE